jgi:protein-tyrosine phosphatase
MQPHLVAEGLPSVVLASEHFFDDVVFQRLVAGAGLPYPGKNVLLEFPPHAFPARAAHRFFDLKKTGLGVVLAHPERYKPVWQDDECLNPLLDAGAHLLLDVCSLVGKYGKASQRAAEKLLEEDAYEAACSDAHKPADLAVVRDAMLRLESLAGKDEAHRLISSGPLGLRTGGHAADASKPS